MTLSSSSMPLTAHRAETLSRMFVRNAAGEMIQLSNIVSITETVAPKDLRRFNQLRSVTIQANVAPGYTLGQALQAVQSGGGRGAALQCR